MKELEGELEAGHTMLLADVLHSLGDPPVHYLTDKDLKKEYEYFKEHLIGENSF